MTARRRPVARFTWWEDEPPAQPTKPAFYTIAVTYDIWQLQSWRTRLLNWIQRRIANMANELIPMADVQTDPRPNTFIAVDVEVPGPDAPDNEVRFVGTFVRWTNDDPRSMILETPNGEQIDILGYAIIRGWWAPMGYRP